VGTPRHPTAAWVAQQLRDATPCDAPPQSRIHDHDRNYGQAATRVVAASGITELRTAYRAPRQNATCERFLGSVRRACTDHVLVLGERHLARVRRAYAASCNTARLHQGRQQRRPAGSAGAVLRPPTGGQVQAVRVRGGLHHAYQRAAERAMDCTWMRQPARTGHRHRGFRAREHPDGL
jgi:putative transposase